MRRPFHLAARAALVALASAGCGSSSSGSGDKAPVIDALDMPASVTGSGGVYDISGTIGYHDDDGTVDAVHVKFAQGGFEETLDTATASAPHPKQATSKLTLHADGAPVGTKLDYDVWVVDSGGVESAHQSRSTVLQ